MGMEGVAAVELSVGTAVEVRTRFDGRWVGGYLVASFSDGRLRVARTAGGEVLPGTFGPEEVRPVSLAAPGHRATVD